MYQFNEYRDYNYLRWKKPTYQAKTYSAKKLKEKFIERLMLGEPVEVRDNIEGILTQDLFNPRTVVYSKWFSKCWQFSEVPDPPEGKYSSLDICTFLRENKIPIAQLGTLCYFIQVYYASYGIRLMKDDFINTYNMGMITDEIDTEIYCTIGWNNSWGTDTELDDIDKEIILALIDKMKDKNIEMVYELPKELNKTYISYYDMRRYYNTPVSIEDFYSKIILNK